MVRQEVTWLDRKWHGKTGSGMVRQEVTWLNRKWH